MPRPLKKPFNMALIESRKTLKMNSVYTVRMVSCMLTSCVISSRNMPMNICRAILCKIEMRIWNVSTDLQQYFAPVTLAAPISRPQSVALVEAKEQPTRRQNIMAPSKVIVVYCSVTPNHPVTKARSCHYQVSIQNMINCGIPQYKYWQRLQQVLKVGKKLAGFMRTLQCEMMVKIR